jgi:hypothetical protein
VETLVSLFLRNSGGISYIEGNDLLTPDYGGRVSDEAVGTDEIAIGIRPADAVETGDHEDSYATLHDCAD